MPLAYTDMLQVRNKIAVYWFRPEYDNKYGRSKNMFQIRNFNNSKTYTGMITASTAKRIRRTVDLLLQIAKPYKTINPFTKATITHRLSFITLTISDNKTMYTPREGHKLLLKPFLRILREKDLMNTYIWKAEFQERGQLHYHITTPSVIDLRLIRKYWNGLQQKNNMLNEYYNEHYHYDPNSTDIHQVHQIKDIQAYLVKYLSKNTQNQTPTTGKIWDCSENLKGKKFLSFEIDNANRRKILRMADDNKISIKQLEQCAIIEGINFNPTSLLSKTQTDQYNLFLQTFTNNTKG
jgi:hypothetical protein